MRTPSLDPTAGQTARSIRFWPGAPQPILDPTDPRYGKWTSASRGFVGGAQRIVDPTNPNCGKPAA